MSPRLLAVAALALLSCSGEPPSPDAAVRATLAAIEASAGERDPDGLEEHISDSYADARGNDKRAVVGIAALHLLRNQAVYTFSRIQEVDTTEPGRAAVRALVALAGRPIRDAASLASVRADLYRFDVTLREEEPGAWRVISAAWHPASLADFR